MPHSQGLGAIFGIVSENGVAKVGGRVGLYDRTTMALVAKTIADSLGGYAFTGINQNTNDYLVMALDDDGSPAKNALVQDYIQPIPAHMGSVAYMNWYYLAISKSPLSLWTGDVIEASPRTGKPYNINAIAQGSILSGLASATPGAPQMPTVTLQSASLDFGVRVRDTSYAIPPSPKWSLEWVVNTSAPTPIQCLTFRQGTNVQFEGDVGFPMTTLYWDKGTNALWSGYAAADYQQNTQYYNPASSAWRSNSFAWPGHGNTWHHLVFVVETGVSSKLYIDGVLVQTWSQIGQITSYPSYGIHRGTKICGYATSTQSWFSPPPCSGTTGPFASYDRALSQTDVTAHYNALMVGSSPMLSGYQRDVVTDAPSLYVRMNAGSIGTEPDFLTGELATHYGAVTLQLPSIVTGGALTGFNGGALRGGIGGPLGRNQGTIEFIMSPNASPPVATQNIVATMFANDTTVMWKVQHLITSGQIRLLLLKSDSTVETLDFVYVPVAGVSVLITITIDKTSTTGPSAKLYENGILKDTRVPAVTFLYGPYFGIVSENGPINPPSAQNRVLHVGGIKLTSGAITEAFVGKIGEVAIYSHALTPDRVVSHYNSRTLI